MRSLVAAGLLLAVIFPGPALAERVSFREAILRLSPSPFGAIKAKLPYDTEVLVKEIRALNPLLERISISQVGRQQRFHDAMLRV